MADNFSTDTVTGGGPTFASDDIASVQFPRVKITLGANGVNDGDVSSANAMPVDASGTAVPVTDNSSSLTVDNVAIDNAHSEDYDTGAGTDTTSAFGIALPASGGAVAATGDTTNGLDVDVTRVGGTVTVDNAGTFAVQVDAAIPAGSNNIGDVDIVSLPNEGQQTMANSISVAVASDQSVLSVDDNAGSLTIDNTNIDNLHSSDFDSGGGTDTTPAIGLVVPASGGAAVITGDVTNGLDVDVTRVGGTVTVDNGGTFAVQVDAALPAGDNNIGNVDIVTLPDEGQQTMANSISIAVASDQSSLTVDNANIDNLHSEDFDTGAGVDTTPAIGLVAPSVTGAVVIPGDATNGLDVDVTRVQGVVSVDDNGGALTVDNGGTFVVQEDGAALTALQVIDNPVIVDDAAFTPASTSVMMAGFEFDDTAPDSVNEGDAGAARMSANRNIYTTLRDAAGSERGVNINASNQMAVSVDNSPTLGANNGVDIGDVTVNNGAGGSAVNIQDGGNSITIDGTVTASNTAGDVAHDTADSGNPVKIGGVARTATPTAVADGDRVDLYCDDLGRAVTVPHAPRDRTVHNRISLTTTTETTLIAAGGAGVFRDLAFLSLSNESATEVRVDIADSTAGTDRISIDLAASGGGAIIPFPVPLTQATANNNWTATLSGTVSTVYITAIAVEGN